MTKVHVLSRRDARRIAVRAQLLAEPRPTDLLDVVRHLTHLQANPTAAVAANAELVLWSRLGSSFEPADLEVAWASGALVELQGMLRPAGDLTLYRAEMAGWPGTGELKDWQVEKRDWLLANDHSRRDILDKPAAKRRWGYWAMPVLSGDRLVGKLDATADRRGGVLRVDAVHEDGRWTKKLRAEVDREIHDLAGWLGLEVERFNA